MDEIDRICEMVTDGEGRSCMGLQIARRAAMICGGELRCRCNDEGVCTFAFELKIDA
jgi:hypothetical protein